MASWQAATDDAGQPGVGQIVIGDGSEDDFAEIVALDERVTGLSRPEFWHEFRLQKATSNALIVLVARHAGEIVGYATGEVRTWPVRGSACGWVYAIGVAKEHRLKRAGSALMAEMISRFRASGIGTIRTMIDVDDHLLMSFLRSMGMTAGPFVELEMPIA
ncbi:MAG: GNAT family N-acetyltransferase [Xanthobacteraceae bacterium]|nr:GNAT family N-acetyltransferase [Xanthobacteraceae bacterium]